MKTFHPNCTLPTGPGFVSSPNVRGTLDVVWSCLSILITSTWSIQHPNLPHQVRDQTVWQMARFQWHQTGRKVFYMIFAVLVPEYFVLVAMSELASAHRHTIRFQSQAYITRTRVKWSVSHTFFANMGGFQIKFDEDLVINTKDMPKLYDFHPAPVYATPIFSRDHGDTSEALLDVGRKDPMYSAFKRASRFGKVSGRPLFRDAIREFIKEHIWKSKAYSERLGTKDYRAAIEACFFQSNIWTVDAAQLITACRQGLVDVPNITEEELKDKSKSDVMVKILAITQGSWMVIQIISRVAWNPRLPSSQLEIGTIAIASCMLCVYALLWSKPQNVSTAVIIVAKRAPTKADIHEIVHANGNTRLRTDFVVPWGPITDGVEAPEFWRVCGNIIIGVGITMGMIHVCAWHFSFPTRVDTLIWRVMAGVTAWFPILAIPWTLILTRISAMVWPKVEEHSKAAFWFTVLGPYILARLLLVVEMFRCLYFMPPGGYIATWASEIPSIG